MSALTDDRPIFEPLPGWGLSSDADEFLTQLAKTPSFGQDDAERVAKFMATATAAQYIPPALHAQLQARGLL